MQTDCSESGKRPTATLIQKEKKQRRCAVWRKSSRGRANRRGSDSFVDENGLGSPDMRKRHFNKTVARKFGILPPQGCGVQALAISQIQALFSLPSKSTFYTCSHEGRLDPWKPHADKQTWTDISVSTQMSVEGANRTSLSPRVSPLAVDNLGLQHEALQQLALSYILLWC